MRFAQQDTWLDHARPVFKPTRPEKHLPVALVPIVKSRSQLAISPFDCLGRRNAQRYGQGCDGVEALKAAVALLVGAILAAGLPGTASAQVLTGLAIVLDGDTLMIDGQRIHILDVDAPESGQLCFKKGAAAGQDDWACGRQAATALSDWIDRRPVTCDTTIQDARTGWLARCTVGGEDVAHWLAANGWAVPASTCKCEVVRSASAQAEAAQLGIWSSNFTMPWDWRKAH